LLVDQVADTFSASPKDLSPPPPNLHGVQSHHLLGVCRGNDRLVALLNLNTLLQLDGLLQPAEATQPVAA
jgi:chemotaxis signal transduction protein